MSLEETIAQDKALVERARQDPEAFGLIFDLYYRQIFSYVLRRTGDAEAAEDIVAETFGKALRGLWRYVWRGVPLSAWLYRIAGNEIKMHSRRKNTRRAVSLEELREQGFDPADDAVQSEQEFLNAVLLEDAQYARAAAALRTLGSRYQEAISLRYMEEKEIGEIAAIMGAREGTVRSLLSRGLSMLREKLAAQMQQNGAESITTNEGRGVLSAVTRNIS